VDLKVGAKRKERKGKVSKTKQEKRSRSTQDRGSVDRRDSFREGRQTFQNSRVKIQNPGRSAWRNFWTKKFSENKKKRFVKE